MSFVFPWALLGLLAMPVLVAAYRRADRARTQRRAELGLPPGPGRGRLVPALLLGGLALLVLAAARPQATVSELRREGTVVLAFDSSRSMTATDLQPSRLEAAKAAAKAFVEQAPDSIRIGVVGFGDGAAVLSHPSGTHQDALAAIDRLTPQGGTSLGQGIFSSLKAIGGGEISIPEAALDDGVDIDELDIGYVGSAVIVLLSDGEDNSRLDPVKLARLAATAGVRIDTVGIGSPDGATVTVDGVSVATALDEQLLTQVASATGGSYRPAADVADLAEVYGTIDLKLTAIPSPTEVSAVPVLASVLLLLLGAGRAVLTTGRVI